MQKSEGIEDLRVRRTRKMLQQAFVELTVEKGFAALTVSDITERAMVNRSTFYRHYLDKYDLLEQYMDEISDLLEERSGKIEPDSHEVPSGLVELLQHIQQNAAFYRVMLGEKGDSLFAQRFRKKTETCFLAWFRQASPEPISQSVAPLLDLRCNIIVSASCGAITWWLDQEHPCSPEQFANFLTPFIYDIAVSSLKLKG